MEQRRQHEIDRWPKPAALGRSPRSQRGSTKQWRQQCACTQCICRAAMDGDRDRQHGSCPLLPTWARVLCQQPTRAPEYGSRQQMVGPPGLGSAKTHAHRQQRAHRTQRLQRPYWWPDSGCHTRSWDQGAMTVGMWASTIRQQKAGAIVCS